ncbi:hypothetical protein N3K66_000846 [Trichothecium roseum]|uniref:Uncharacterized protein n=1 Tax=Trichothecium roseum TaxID=47278 RepID=A0ACC0VD04_9HYPO|nr:hypothetical protein N3K66_000846 [Trichothecium roseum]
MMVYEPEAFPTESQPYLHDVTGNAWIPMYKHDCSFGPEIFESKMLNVIKNPNLNSSWLFRADIIYDDVDDDDKDSSVEVGSVKPLSLDLEDLPTHRSLVRTMVPRNAKRDRPLDQTCTFHRAERQDGTVRSAVIYFPHVDSPQDMPFYHPKVRGIAYLHDYDAASSRGTISIHYLAFPEHPLSPAPDPKLARIAYHLLEILHKHGEAPDYAKRVHHDVVVPQARFQNRYAALKASYARELIGGWAETTDPDKHVFEDLGIAAFLIELWADMYGEENPFPGFVDIGCGNGLLVYILRREGYQGWGFDARRRKSWAQYNAPFSGTDASDSLQQLLLLPSILTDGDEPPAPERTCHDGVFPAGTFIISNHADELTPWTPILAAVSGCPFIAIPCCSHNLAGARYRAPPPRDKSKGKSTYASLVDWVVRIAEDCGWDVETEMMRIPSTRNTCLLGRTRNKGADVDYGALLHKYGGVAGYKETVAQLVKAEARGH